jgi:hypothetical protein
MPVRELVLRSASAVGSDSLENLFAVPDLTRVESAGNTFRRRKMQEAHRVSARWAFLFLSGQEWTGGDRRGL